jgi:nitronate monooxygenase
MLHTRLCELLGIEFPIIAAQLGPDLTGPELVAAVSNAGGLGIVQAQLSPPPVLRQELQRLRSMTEKPFGVNFLLPFPSDDTFRVCLEAGVSVFSFFWGDPSSLEARAHPVYKQKLREATETDTVRTILFGHGWPYAPHRALRTAFVSQWLG